MYKSFRWKLITAYFLLILIVLTIAGGIIFYAFKNFYLTTLEKNLINESSLITEIIKYSQSRSKFQEICDAAAENSNSRVTIIDDSGVVLGDSQYDCHEMELHNDRPEVNKALQGEIGMEMRYSHTIKMQMLYVAVPFMQDNKRGVVRLSVALKKLQDIYKNIWLIILIAISISSISSFIISLFLAERFSRPLHDIIGAVNDMASGNLKRHVLYKSNDELGILSESFNNMAEHIERSVDEISELKNRFEILLENSINGIIMFDVEARMSYANPVASTLLSLDRESIGHKHVEIINNYELLEIIDGVRNEGKAIGSEIRLYFPDYKIINVYAIPLQGSLESSGIMLILNDITEIKRLENVRRDFVENVSHELKTPVATISGFAETLLDEDAEDIENVKEFSKIIYDESQRLSKLVTGLLELSRLESDSSWLNKKQLDIGELINQIINIVKQRNMLKDNRIEFIRPAEPVIINSDEELVSHVLHNILDNAIKYSSDRDTVTVKLETEGEKIRVSVIDNGIGIPVTDIQRIFERFYRVDKTRSRKTGGTGLGLSIVKHILGRLGGEILVTSIDGKGSTFTFTLPVS